jgi:dTDP-4-dehydrorhamnose 3,5-epimerase
MKIQDSKLPEVKIIEPVIFKDDRGYFFESFNQNNFNHLLKANLSFVQDNQSYSKYGVLRGLHYQTEPFSQGKLVRVIYGEVFDVAVDIRKDSETYGRWVGEILSSNNFKQLWIPEGFAHGFLTLSNTAIVSYKTTNYYSKDHEINIRFDTFNIDWPKLNINYILSTKDS